MDQTIVLKYVGGAAGLYIPGVPACDLTQTQIDESGFTKDELLIFHSGDQTLYMEVN